MKRKNKEGREKENLKETRYDDLSPSSKKGIFFLALASLVLIVLLLISRTWG